MDESAERLERLSVPDLDRILGTPFKVLDDGFIRVIDYMGSDASIVQAARVSYGAGTKKVHEDRGLIRYLMRHRHTTPFEMCEIKLHVRVPMDCWRQWIRHRTACLSGETEVYFDLPAAVQSHRPQLYKIRVEDLWRRFQPTRNTQRPDKQKNPYFRRDRVRAMMLRQIDEDSLLVQRTSLVNVSRSGAKEVFRMVLEDGKAIECTADHRFYFDRGWMSLAEATGLHQVEGMAVWARGDYKLFVNGAPVESSNLYRSKEWLEPLRGSPVKTPSRPRLRKAWNTLTVARLARIVSFDYVGVKETYDLQVDGPYHNFIANGIVTHNSVNEYSTRYSVAIDAAQKTPPSEWRVQAGGNRQGSEGFLEEAKGAELSAKEGELLDRSRTIYQERLSAGVAREQARKDLPLSTYTEAYWKIDLHNLFHFLALRMDDHAQEEIRAYAAIIGQEIVSKWCPLAWEAFLDYRRGALELSKIEIQVLQALGRGDTSGARAIAEGAGWLEEGPKGLRPNREREELARKLDLLNLPVPWRAPG